MCVRWIAYSLSLVVMALLLPAEVSRSSGTLSTTKSQCNLSSSDGIQKVLCFIQEEQSLTDAELSEVLGEPDIS